MVKFTEEQILEFISEHYKNKNHHPGSPRKGRKGHYRELFEQTRKKGFTKMRVDGVVVDIEANMQVDRFKTHDIEVVIDRLRADDDNNRELRHR